MSEEQGAFIAPGTQIRGRIYGDADVVVEGSIEGAVSISRTLYVEPNGNVEAEVAAAHIQVRGQLGGRAQANDMIHLEANSTTTAALHAPRIEVDEGARLACTFHMHVELPEGVEVPEHEEESA